MEDQNKKQGHIELFFVKGGFLYNVYSEKNVALGSSKCESEVTQYAVEIYKNYYEPYQKDCWAIGNNGKELKKRRPQMSTKGCYLKITNSDKKPNINIVGDILTSPGTPLKKCLGVSNIPKEYLQYLFKCCCLDCVQEKIREIAKWGKVDFDTKYGGYEQLIQSAAAFVLVSHTIGNMMPIPEGLNTLWRTNGDGWDWIKGKVKLLKNILDGKNNIDPEINKVEERIRQGLTLGPIKKVQALKKEGIIGKWYKQENIKPKSWKDFIEQNFLQDVFEESEDCSYSKIREDLVTPPKNNKNLDEWCRWFDTMTKLIISRGWRIMHKGREIDKDGESKNGILEFLQINN